MTQLNIKNFPNRYFNEPIILRKFKGNNFIQQLICSFHDYDNLYFVTKLYRGYMEDYMNDNWNEKQIQFFSACLIQAFENLRKKQIIHRDVHFKNLVLDEKQYINLIDFHIAIDYNSKDDPKNNFVGSPNLCAPEMIYGLNYDYNSDYYRLGGMLYYNMFKIYPNDLAIINKMEDIMITCNKSNNYSNSCIDFINKLIIYNKKYRLGVKGISELKNHAFFKNFNWNKLIDRSMKSPFKFKASKIKFACRQKQIYKKEKFLVTSFLYNKTFKNILFGYDNINDEFVEKIIRYIKIKIN